MASNTFIQTNILSLNSHRNLNLLSTTQARAAQRLSSGFHINSAADDAAGLGIASIMRAQIRGFDRASHNAQDGISLLQTAEGALSTINEMIIRMRELVVQASNDTNVHNHGYNAQSDRLRIQAEIVQIMDEINSVSNRTEFNTRKLLDGSLDRHIKWLNRPRVFAPAIPMSPLRPLPDPPKPTPPATVPPPTIPGTNIPARPNLIEPTSLSTPPIPTVTINASDLVIGNHGTWSFSAGGVLTLHGNGEVFQINGAGMSALDRIVVDSGITADVVLNNVDIITNTGSAFNMQGATVNMWLSGSNDLSVLGMFYGHAGILTTDGNLTINGTGFLRAHGSEGSAGIGSNTGASDSGNITINSGTIFAIGGIRGAAIGSGSDAHGGNITINGGDIIAIGGDWAAGIGSGHSGHGGNITITGGNITAISERNGAGIGSGSDGNGGNIIITGGEITAFGRFGAAGIGSGGGTAGHGGNIRIDGGIITASSDGRGAAIGGGWGDNGATLVINGGLVEIGEGQWIGSGYDAFLNTGTTTINGGNLSIHNPYNIHTGATHSGRTAFRVQIFLQDENGNAVSFGQHTAVTYTINGLVINAITDSAGNLFMYLPEDFDESTGMMSFNGRIFRGELSMSDNHDNRLILRIAEDTPEPPPLPPLPPQEPIPPSLPHTPLPDPGHSLWFHTGANSGQGIFVNIAAMHTRALGGPNGDLADLINVANPSGRPISQQLVYLDDALTHATRERSRLGAVQNRLEFAIKSLQISSENLQASESRIKDADMAREMVNLTTANVLQQAAVSMLAQANQSSQNVLHLLDVV